MYRSCLSAYSTEPHGVRIKGGCIKALGAENCDINILAAIGIYSIGVAARSNVDGNQHSPLELNRSDIAGANTRIS